MPPFITRAAMDAGERLHIPQAPNQWRTASCVDCFRLTHATNATKCSCNRADRRDRRRRLAFAQKSGPAQIMDGLSLDPLDCRLPVLQEVLVRFRPGAPNCGRSEQSCELIQLLRMPALRQKLRFD